jgi:PAS domain S-box-containing protein
LRKNKDNLEFNLAQNNPLFGREQLLNQVVEGIQDYAILLLDNQGYILTWNKGAERIKGFHLEEILGKHFSIFYTEEDIANAKPRQALSVALKQGRYAEEGWRVRKDGSRFWADVVITPLYDTQGKHEGFIKITKDLAERRESEEKFRWILESAPDAITIVDFEGKIQMVNAQTESIFGYKREEMIGKEIEMLIPERYIEKHYHHRQVYNSNPKTRAMGVGLDLYGKRKSGEEFPVEISLSPVNLSGDGGVLVFAAIRDITMQKQAERAIKELNEELDKRIAERTSELELSLENEKRALSQASLNQQKLIFLSKASEILSSSLDYGKTLSDLANFITPTIADWCIIHEVQPDGNVKPIIISHIDPQKIKLGFELAEKFPYDPVLHKGLYKVLRTRKPEFIPLVPAVLLRTLSKGNEQYKLIHDLGINSVISIPLIVHNIEYGMMTLLLEGPGKVFDEHDLVMAKEIARRTTLAIENGRLYNEAQELNKDLEQRVAARTLELQTINKELESFSYSVSHDLRAPLRSIDGFSNIILKKYAPLLDKEGQDYFQRVMNATRQMGQLIDDLLKLARLTRVEMTLEPVNLSEMASVVAQEFISAQPERKVNLFIEPEIITKADRNLIQVALHNLFENAFKYSRNNEITEIHFGKKVEDGKNVYYISDNGVGFDMKYVDKLFGAFQRLHSTKEFEGTGIGLATVQRIIHRHKGTIRAESEVGKGTTFYFTLSD